MQFTMHFDIAIHVPVGSWIAALIDFFKKK
jgi:hypothetical protein